ncbi:PTS glucitol/sorbitol transporter subunit IIA [Lacticaseibacillus baoqingensis]|uniref:PTS glucitol/sorbitol transporter subunit IIA n=1 Tax=Lacticaseibacillus baoqingensis TaxID=2486013 RepID=A0ABW4E4D8_9LACO|nr:PTS glucitol/sorbitol transporter subunit IIA [Lacticaseibacillus baoqingensis]
MKTTAVVTAIGAHALDPADPLVILFDEDATAALRDVTVIQRFNDPQQQASLTVKPGDHLALAGHTYEIMRVGQLANTNLRTIGHVSLIFQAIPAQPMENALYLEPLQKPTLAVGDELTYITE